MVLVSISNERDALLLELSRLEKLGALHGNLRVALSSIEAVTVCYQPWAERPWHGIRVGTGCPWVVLLGRTVHCGSVDFVAVYGRKTPACVIHLKPEAPEGLRAVIFTSPEAETVAKELGALLTTKPAVAVS